ncbi:MAG: hypothetical protein ACI9LY_003196, partial [Arenicella sp.]
HKNTVNNGNRQLKRSPRSIKHINVLCSLDCALILENEWRGLILSHCNRQLNKAWAGLV